MSLFGGVCGSTKRFSTVLTKIVAVQYVLKLINLSSFFPKLSKDKLHMSWLILFLLVSIFQTS